MINTSASTVQIGKNVKIGYGEPLELRGDEVVESEVRANYKDSEFEESENYESRKRNKVYHVSEMAEKS